MEELRCGLVSFSPFPVGNVAAMRYSSYMISLAKAGVFSKVYIYTPSRTAKPNLYVSGIHRGVLYEYTSGKIYLQKRNIFLQLYYLVIGLLTSWISIGRDNINCLILYGENPWIINLYYKILCSIKRIRFYGDRSELPSQDIRHSRVKTKIYSLKIRWFDGMILMTDSLVSYYAGLMNNSKSFILLPMTIDPSRFDYIERNIVSKRYIAVVFGTHNRDGLKDSLLAYNLYRDKGGTYSLYLVGDYNKMPNKSELDLIIFSSRYSNDIKICGTIQNDLLPQLLVDASTLLTTPKEYISGGFPTKIGEYMLSGTPIVCTKAGDLPKYLEHNVDVLFAEPQDIEGVSDNLLYVENHTAEVRTIAENARKKVLKVFNADTYLNDLITFLKIK